MRVRMIRSLNRELLKAKVHYGCTGKAVVSGVELDCFRKTFVDVCRFLIGEITMRIIR